MNELATRMYVAPSDVACIYIGLDDKHRALEWLEKGYEERDFNLVRLKVDPRLDPLRDVPRFQDLLRRMYFPE